MGILLAVAMLLTPDDWPQFRGPNGAGTSTNTRLPVEMGPAKNVVWRTALPLGHSSPILVGSRIFLTAVEKDALLTICLDRSTGRILWRKDAPRPRKEQFQKTNSPAAPTPASDGQSVFVFFGDFGMLAYSLDGQERWRVPLGPFNNQNGHGSSPIVAGDAVYLICDQDTGSYVIAVDKRSGKTIWKAMRPGITRGYATPALWHDQLVVPGSYQVVSYDLKTGAKVWWVNGMAWQVKSVPVIDGDVVYVNTWEIFGDFATPPEIDSFETMLSRFDSDKNGVLSGEELSTYFKGKNGIYDYDLNKDGSLDREEWEAYIRLRSASNNLVAIKAGGKGDITGNVLWRYRKSLPNVPSPLFYGGALFLVKDGGVVTTLDPKAGEVLKQARVPGALEQYWASPVGADGKVYLLSQGCKLSVLDAKPQWEVLKVNDLDDECFATPAIADGGLYVRTRGWLYFFKN